MAAISKHGLTVLRAERRWQDDDGNGESRRTVLYAVKHDKATRLEKVDSLPKLGPVHSWGWKLAGKYTGPCTMDWLQSRRRHLEGQGYLVTVFLPRNLDGGA